MNTLWQRAVVFAAGLLAGVLAAVLVRCQEPVQLPKASAPVCSTWVLRSQHFLHGMPHPTDDRYNHMLKDDGRTVPGISVLVREGFVLGHADRFKVPLWVSYRWDRACYYASEAIKDPARSFKPDSELPDYARADASYGTEGRARDLQRGHMARNKDNAAWGSDNAESGDLMSNIVPQAAALNQGVWKALEDQHRRLVASGPIRQIWVICGAVFQNTAAEYCVGNDIGVPQAVYKIVAREDKKSGLQARGFIFPQRCESKDPARYLVPIAEIEQQTGLCFFPELNSAESSKLKHAAPARLWRAE